MKKSKLVDIFKVISVQEMRSFNEYVQSPYFNKRQDVIQFCSYLTKQAKANFPDKKIEQEQCWQAVFPSKKFNKKEMAHLMSRLNQLAEDFLAQRHFEEKQSKLAFYKLEAFAKSSLNKHYQQLLKTIKKELDSSSLEDADQLWNQYTLAQIQDYHFGLQNQRALNVYLAEKNQYLDRFFSLKKLQIFCNLHFQQIAFGAPQDMSWPASPLQASAAPQASKVYATYLSLYRLLQGHEDSEQAFIALKTALKQLKNKLSHLEYIDLYFFAINYCSIAINKGKRHYASHLLALYEDGLAQETLLLNQTLSPWIYKNIVKLGLGLKKFEWTEEFIENYSPKLPVDQSEDAYYFNLANLNYYQKNYDQALNYLNRVEFTDLYYKHGAKAMLLKIYFEKQETEAFLGLVSSFKILLMRDQQIPNDLKSNYLNFIRFSAKLFKLRKSDHAALDKLKQSMEKTPKINGRNWLMQQLKAVKK